MNLSAELRCQFRKLIHDHSNHMHLAPTDCGSVVNNSLETPGYPNNYPNNKHCVYTVPIPQNMEINIYFSEFEVEHGPLCRYVID